MAALGLCAVKQIFIFAKKAYTVKEEIQVIKNIQDSASLIPEAEENFTDKEQFNVLKSNKINTSPDHVFKILQHLPRKRNGKIKIEESILPR